MSKKGVYEIFGVPEPPGSNEFCGFSFRTRKEPRSSVRFWAATGGLVNSCSAAAGRAPNWTGRAWIRNTPSTAGNSMTGSERPSPEPILKKRRPQPYWGGEISGNALEASNALNYWVWGIPAVLSRGIPGNALRAFPVSFRNFSEISSGKSQPYWGYGPLKHPKDPAVLKILRRINSLSPY